MIKSGHKIEFASKHDNISLIEDFISDIFKEYDINEQLYGNVLIATTEAIINAIIHGNKKDESKLVSLKAINDNNKMIFIVEDQGVGFDHKKLPDPTSPENIEKPTGRGVFLMKQLADKIIFNKKGNSVEIHFEIK